MTQAERPQSGQPVPDQPLADRSAAQQPLTEQPRPDRPLTGRPGSEGRVPEQGVPVRPLAERPAAAQGVSNDLGSDRPDAGRPAREAVPEGDAEADRVLAPQDREKLQLRIQHAVGGFVDEPRSAVKEAASVVDALTEQLVRSLEQRRDTMRSSWKDASGGTATEDLRMALREYRRLAERLLSL